MLSSHLAGASKLTRNQAPKAAQPAVKQATSLNGVASSASDTSGFGLSSDLLLTTAGLPLRGS